MFDNHPFYSVYRSHYVVPDTTSPSGAGTVQPKPAIFREFYHKFYQVNGTGLSGAGITPNRGHPFKDFRLGTNFYKTNGVL